MAHALAYPNARQGKKDTSQNICEVNRESVRQARFILHNCRDKAIEVLRNAKYPLSVAYEEAQAIVEEQRLAEEERQRQLAALAVLREEFGDLAALVDDQRLGLPLRLHQPVGSILPSKPAPGAPWVGVGAF